MWESEKKQIIEAAQELEKKGLVVGTAGNISLRLKDPAGKDLLTITPSGRYYESLKVDDILVVDFSGQKVEGELKPSIETPMHIEVLKARKKMNAVVHAHAPFCSALAVAHMEIPPIIDEQVILLGGEIRVADYAFPGTPELAKSAVAGLGPRNAVLLANHGVLTVGRDMREALTFCELVEELAKIYISAFRLGMVNHIPTEAVELEKAFFAATYGEEVS
jgi:L-fuculose-phosphate aldolase